MSTPSLPNTAQLEVPAVLLPYQQRWIADTSPLKVEEKSRRTGLTWAEAADNVLTAAAEKSAGGQNVYYIAYNQDMTVEYIQACAMWARAFNRAASEVEEGLWEDDEADKHIKTFTIRFPASGHRIVALTSRPSNLRGRQGTIVIDEAAFHEDLKELLKAAMAMLIWGGRVRVISTHNGIENPFNELVQDIRAGKRRGSVHRLSFREAVTDGLYRRVCLRLGKAWSAEDEARWVQEVYEFYGDGADEELDCVPKNGGGAYLSRGLLESRMSDQVPVLRYGQTDEFAFQAEDIRQADVLEWCERELAPVLASIPGDQPTYLGEDFGRSGDLTVIVVLQRTQSLRRSARFILELRNMPFRQQEQILFYLIDRLPRFTRGLMDGRGNGQYLAEVAVQKYGQLRIGAVMLTESWYLEQMPRFKADLEDGTLADLPRDADVLDDLRAFQWMRGVPRLPDVRTTSADGKKRHGDAGIAVVLADTAAREEPVAMAFEAAPRHHHFSDEIHNDLDDAFDAAGGSACW